LGKDIYNMYKNLNLVSQKNKENGTKRLITIKRIIVTGH